MAFQVVHDKRSKQSHDFVFSVRGDVALLSIFPHYRLSGIGIQDARFYRFDILLATKAPAESGPASASVRTTTPRQSNLI